MFWVRVALLGFLLGVGALASAQTRPSLLQEFPTQSANQCLCGPTSGGAATPGFRAQVAADIPALGIYALLAGRTGTTNDLTLSTDSNGTLIGSSGGNTLDLVLKANSSTSGGTGRIALFSPVSIGDGLTAALLGDTDWQRFLKMDQRLDLSGTSNVGLEVMDFAGTYLVKKNSQVFSTIFQEDHFTNASGAGSGQRTSLTAFNVASYLDSLSTGQPPIDSIVFNDTATVTAVADSSSAPVQKAYGYSRSPSMNGTEWRCNTGTRADLLCSPSSGTWTPTDSVTGCSGGICTEGGHCNAGTRLNKLCTTDDTNATTGCPSATCPTCCVASSKLVVTDVHGFDDGLSLATNSVATGGSVKATNRYGYHFQAPSVSGVGTKTIDTSLGFWVDDQTVSGLTYGVMAAAFRSDMTTGAQKWNALDTGGAQWALKGALALGTNLAGLKMTTVATPGAPTVTPTCNSSCTATWGYKVTAVTPGGETPASSETTTTAGKLTIDGTNFNTIAWNTVDGVTSYNVYRTNVTGGGTHVPATTGLIGSVTAFASGQPSLADTGLTAGASAPSVDRSATIVAGGSPASLGGVATDIRFGIVLPYPSLEFKGVASSVLIALAVGADATNTQQTWTVSADNPGLQGASLFSFKPIVINSPATAGTTRTTGTWNELGYQPTFNVDGVDGTNTFTVAANNALFMAPVCGRTATGGNTSTMVMTALTAVNDSPTINTGCTTTTRRLAWFQAPAGSGTQTTAVGLDCADQSATTLACLRSAIASGSGKYGLNITGTAQSIIGGKLRIGDSTDPTDYLDIVGKLVASNAGVITRYNNVAKDSSHNGVPFIIASATATAQGANISGTNLITSAAAGRYRLSCYIAVTRQATTTATIPNCNLICTDPTDSLAKTVQITPADQGVATNPGTAVAVGGSGICDAKVSTAVQYSTSNYASSGGTSMQYKIYVTLESLGPG